MAARGNFRNAVTDSWSPYPPTLSENRTIFQIERARFSEPDPRISSGKTSGGDVRFLFLPVGVDIERTGRAANHFFRNDDFADAFQRRQVEHGVEQNLLHDRAQAAGTRLADDRTLGDLAERILVEGQLDVFHLEQALILLDERVLRLGQDLDQRILIEVFQRRQDWQTADEFRDEAELDEILRLQ